LLKANWEIGKYIVDYEQHGNEKAVYGSSLLTNLSKDLKSRFGKGFSKSNIYLMRQFYLKYQIYLPDRKILEQKVKEIMTE